MHDEFVKEPRWAGVRFIKGLLDGPPASALALSLDDCDFGAADRGGTPIEELVPDYAIWMPPDFRDVPGVQPRSCYARRG